MKNRTLILVFAIFFNSCEKDQKQINLKSNINIIAGCNYYSTTSIHNIPPTVSSVSYEYNESTRKLKLTHYNAGFNCCPGVLSCESLLEGNTIKILEKEEGDGCHCLCLYDIEIEVNNIDETEYKIEINEPYSDSNDALNAIINLKSNPTGEFHVTRNYYPWVQ